MRGLRHLVGRFSLLLRASDGTVLGMLGYATLEVLYDSLELPKIGIDRGSWRLIVLTSLLVAVRLVLTGMCVIWLHNAVSGLSVIYYSVVILSYRLSVGEACLNKQFYYK